MSGLTLIRIVFNKKEVAETFDEADNFYKDRRTIVYARNFCFQAARQLGFKYFLELDDDYIHFRFTLDKFKNYTVQMCKNLELVDEMARAGMDFFPVPVVSEEHRKQLASQAHDIMNVVM